MKKWTFILIPLAVFLFVGFTGISAHSIYSLPSKIENSDLSEKVKPVIESKEKTTPVQAEVYSTNLENPEPIQDNSRTINVQEEPVVTSAPEAAENYIDSYNFSADSTYCPNYENCPNYEDCPYYYSDDCSGYGYRNDQGNGCHGNGRGCCLN